MTVKGLGARPGRRPFLVWAVAAVALGGRQGRAQNTDPRQPVVELYAALHAAMRMGHAAPFRQRFDELAPAIEQAFDLDAILQTSVGLRWSHLAHWVC